MNIVVQGCAGSTLEARLPPIGMMGVAAEEEGVDVEEFDMNADGRTDIWRYYQVLLDQAPRDTPDDEAGAEASRRAQRLLIREDMDLNFDGRVDMQVFYNEEGMVLREEFDLDFDGQVDMVSEYEDGVLVRQMIDENRDGRMNATHFFEDGAMVRKERDTTGDGVVDRYEYYEGGILVRFVSEPELAEETPAQLEDR